MSHARRSDATRARAIRELERLLRDDPTPGVRAESALALADLAASEALASLLVAVEDDDAHVRQMALSSLGEIGDARAARRLERALGDPRPEVRYQAVIAFARVERGDPDAVATALLKALDDADSAIRYIAMRVAEERLASEESTGDPRLVARAASLVDAPGDDDAVAVVAALYLARLREPRGVAAVLDVIAERRKAPEAEDEQGCVEHPGVLGLTEAVPHLERRAWAPRRVARELFSWGAGDRASCSWHARIALARLGHERARAEILADLASWRRETREAAVVAAGRARLVEARPALERLGESTSPALVHEALLRIGASEAKLDGGGA